VLSAAAPPADARLAARAGSLQASPIPHPTSPLFPVAIAMRAARHEEDMRLLFSVTATAGAALEYSISV